MKDLVSGKDLAEVLQITERRVQQLADEKVIQKTSRGKYEFIPSVQGYIGFLQEKAQGRGESTALSEQRLRIARAKADKEEMEMKRLKGDLVDKSHAVSAWGEAVQMMKTRLLSIPSKLPELNAKHKKAVKDQITKALESIANVEIREPSDSDDSL